MPLQVFYSLDCLHQRGTRVSTGPLSSRGSQCRLSAWLSTQWHTPGALGVFGFSQRVDVFFFLGMSEATRGEDDEKRGGHKVSGGFFAGCITYVLSSKTQNKCSFADESECSIVSSSHRICPRQFTTLNVFLEFFMHFFGVYVKCLSTLQKGAQRVI